MKILLINYNHEIVGGCETMYKYLHKAFPNSELISCNMFKGETLNELKAIVDANKKLVLERLKTLDPYSKIVFGADGKEITVKEMIKHVDGGDDFGKKIINVQMRMLRVLAGGIN